MPLYELICHDCEKPFQQYVHSHRNLGEVACPECGRTGEAIEKLSSASSFIIKGYNAQNRYSKKG